jgi:hypothetical protein
LAGACDSQKTNKGVTWKNRIITLGAFVFVDSQQTFLKVVKEKFSRPGEAALNVYLVCFYSSEKQ